MSEMLTRSEGSPAERVGARLRAALQPQLLRLGQMEGQIAFEPPYSAPAARGALLGTAMALVAWEIDTPTNGDMRDATVAAFTLVFGAERGQPSAWQTIADAAGGNEEVLAGSSRAASDIQAAAGTADPNASDAFYLSVSGLA